jgi:hypothetical protein
MTYRHWFLALLLSLTLTAPVYPSATDFNGTTSQISVTHQASLDSANVSFGCWSRLESNSVSRDILSTTDAGPTVGLEFGYLQPSNTYYLFAVTTVDWPTWTVAAPSLNTWVHVVVTWASPLTTPTIYVNSVSQSVTTVGAPTGTFLPGTSALILGNAVSSLPWDGQLAECFWYNRILTANEVRAVYVRGPRAVRNGLIAYWPLGAYGANNFTSSTGLNGTPTATSVISNGPPLSYSPQGDQP